MTKQEEIREIMEHYITEAMLGNFNEDDIPILTGCMERDLAVQGVVIKVDRELPEHKPTQAELESRRIGKCDYIRHGEYFNTWLCPFNNLKMCKRWNSGECNPEEVKAGYAAVEPLTLDK